MDSIVELLIAGTGLSFTGFFVLCLVSFLGSRNAGALGLGGGVLVGSFVAPACPERPQFVSTHSVVMTIQHGLTIVTSMR